MTGADGRFSRRSLLLRGAGAGLLPLVLGMTPDRSERGMTNLVVFQSGHGGVPPEFMYPDLAMLDGGESLEYADRVVRRGALERTVVDTRASVSPVLTAAENALTDRLVSRLNILRGLDVSFLLSHNVGGCLGNFAANDGLSSDALKERGFPNDTIDNRLAWSPSFYNDLKGVRARSLVLGSPGMSWAFSQPKTRTGVPQRRPSTYSTRRVFDMLFGSDTASGLPNRWAVDRARASFNELIGKDAWVSKSDRERFSVHLDQLAEIERRVRTVPACNPDAPSVDTGIAASAAGFRHSAAEMRTVWQELNALTAVTLGCGASRIITCNALADHMHDFSGEWHTEIAHGWTGDPDKVRLNWQAQQLFFEEVVLDLALRLDAVPGQRGGTVLDETLIVWAQECGPVTHMNASVPVVTLGGAGGRMKTGQYCDYRSKVKLSSTDFLVDDNYSKFDAGLLYNQLLYTILETEGLSRDELVSASEPTIGRVRYATGFDDHYRSAYAMASERLPFL